MIFKYLRYRRFVLLAVAAACAVFCAIMLLYGVSAADTAYAALVYIFIMAFCFTVDLFRFRRKLSVLCEILENISETVHEYPEPSNAVDKAYLDIIRSVYSVMRGERDALTASYSEQLEYYTMWLHQIKTPIAAMRLALENSADPVYEPELVKIERYMDMALQYAKLGAPGGDVVLKPTALDAVVVAAVKKYAALFIYKKLSVDFERTGLVVQSDEKWLQFIIEQFICNCVKYTEAGGVSIYAQDGALVIKDSGIGIRSEDIGRVFENGYTGYNGRYDKRASGLGLHMANKAAAKIGVSLSLSSAPGEGTSARVEFPKDIELIESSLTKL